MKSFKLGEMVYFINSYTAFPFVIFGRIVTISYPRSPLELLHEEDPEYEIFEADDFAKDLNGCHKVGHSKIFHSREQAYIAIEKYLTVETDNKINFVREQAEKDREKPRKTT
jgi:hypothetical protein